ncbi:MAG: N-acetylmuramoyl-L-alanine amidase [Brevundimonas sp.]|uniref:N-acetylmuramoyl-L-alanine amidase n=1 Tax=Brevundimonas sp. TaxID=1871086 RepID=UPI0027361702|nr:N-acetylmuramoyl-L-alanine amidase [Brevundimonas sp.]MDP3377227.1 N-acetylmuramoyl-L-alanine amidase [Brevundimonas sp.]
MRATVKFDLARWGAREWAMTALAFVVLSVLLLTATRGLALGAEGDVLRVRFGGDAQRTRVVIDLDASTRGTLVEAGGSGQLIVDLDNIRAGRGQSGQGMGLVRAYRVAQAGSRSRVELALASGVEVERRFLLSPGDGVDHYRYVIDLKATGQTSTAAPMPSQPRTAAATSPRSRRGDHRPLIVIDPGHGGRDPGASGQHGRESAVTLAAGLALKAELERTGRYRVLMTRSTDVYVGLPRRVEIAREAGADLFISLHADAGADPATRGASVYTLSEQGAGRAVREFTGREDWHRDLHLPGQDPSVDRILLDMTQRSTQNRSALFARSLLGEIERTGHPMLRRSHRDAGLAVLLAPDVPAVLLEMGFVTNPEDERILMDERRRRELMRGVVRGIDVYFQSLEGPVRYAGTPQAGGTP